MSEGHEAGPTVIVIPPGASAEGAGETSVEVQASGEAEQVADAVEEVADPSVEIARIEADRDVTIAAIQAETTEAILEDAHDTELEQCRTRIAELEAQSIVLQTELERLTPPPSQPPPPNPNGSTQPETGEGSTETTTGDGEAVDPETLEAEEAEAPEPPKPRRKPHRWI